MSESKKIFYMNGLPLNIKSKNATQTLFRSHITPLAEWQDEPDSTTKLYSTDDSASILQTSASPEQTIVYTPYGHRPDASAMPLLGFNGELLNTAIGFYLLGIGYHRSYSPAHMRFSCPDSMSPFGGGGINAYAYCSNDPINKIDPSGHVNLRKAIGNFFGRKEKLTQQVNIYNTETEARANAIGRLKFPDQPKTSQDYHLTSIKMEKNMEKLPQVPTLSGEAEKYRDKHFKGESPIIAGVLSELAEEASKKLNAFRMQQREFEKKGEEWRSAARIKAHEEQRLKEEKAREMRDQIRRERRENGVRHP
ncbi:RHS repeat-associated core domain-containing protein [Pseudomonas asiatica]|uniref:RHS repeat-associated core domain-containing protein n=1 Tax=Pseudomonas asiatica TaxID=2219225 RepID=A0A9X4CZ07_9PSED|nr:RHS repeat-associated core domain-containing protein [Pseudomonas asiatica]MDD2106604.1 hypothetical protein [Pseudomonas asiatica]